MDDSNDSAATSVRMMEIAVAVAIFVLGAVVITDSIRLGAKWADDGPQAGYFPFYIGLILCIASVVTLWRAIRDKALAGEVFVTRLQLRLILSVLVPLVVYVALLKFIGIYVASVIFIAWFMLRLGRYGWLITALVSLGTMFAFFMMFEVWFKVPLPKGPLEAAFGFA